MEGGIVGGPPPFLLPPSPSLFLSNVFFPAVMNMNARITNIIECTGISLGNKKLPFPVIKEKK